MQAFTRNYDDNSTDAGFQFTFYCDNCGNGYKSSFVESSVGRKKKGVDGIARGAGLLGSLIGNKASDLGWAAERAGGFLSDRMDDRSPEWRREYDQAFADAQEEVKAQGHFARCHSCQQWVCHDCYNEDEGMCVECAPREDIYVAQARNRAMRRNIDEAVDTETVWSGKLEAKTTVCPECGKPAGTGKFCNNCGASLARNECPRCGATMAPGIKFCNNCGSPMAGGEQQKQRFCVECGTPLEPDVRFCGGCGARS